MFLLMRYAGNSLICLTDELLMLVCSDIYGTDFEQKYNSAWYKITYKDRVTPHAVFLLKMAIFCCTMLRHECISMSESPINR